MSKKRMTVSELVAVAKMKKGPKNRDIEGLVGMLRQVASDLESGKAIEGDFNITVEETSQFDVMDLTLETYHIKKPKESKIILE